MRSLKCFGLLVLVVTLESITCASLRKSIDVTFDKSARGAALSSPSPKQKVEDEEDVVKYLKNFGYLNHKEGISKNSNSENDEVSKGIKKFQKWHKLNVSGELDNATLALMNTPRCQLPDISKPEKFEKRFVVGNTRWQSRNLSYRLHNYPSLTDGTITKEDVDQAIQTAMQDWSSVANLAFYRIENDESNINIGFYRGDHGDDDPFGVDAGVIAHAFFPEIGELHFNDEMMWSKTNKEINLRITASHEMGHVLGLNHTDVAGALMYPMYFYVEDFKLHNDDIDGIVYLYGGKVGSATQL